MFQRIRRSLAAGLLAAFFLALPAPSQAVGLWAPAAPAAWTSQAWSWLEGLVTGKPAAAPRRSAVRQKIEPAAPGTPSILTEPVPGTSGPYQGSGIDPNGSK